MLEQACLVAHPWIRADATTLWTRRITDSAGAYLGFVRLEPPLPGWFAWFRSLKLSVFETEDASHLMTVTRPWAFSRIWDVYDAEDVPVGMIALQVLFASDRTFLGKVKREADGARAVRDPSEKVLATIRRAEQCSEISFTLGTLSNPFLRMMLLAALIAQELPNG